MKIAVLISLLFNITLSQVYNIKNYTKDDGLPHVQIFSLKQDRNGFIWIGTGGGIARFSGHTFENLTMENGLPSHEIYEFYEDDKGFIWLLGSKGIAKINANDLSRINLTVFPNTENDLRVFSIEKIDDTIILGTRLDGIYVFDGKRLSEIKENEIFKSELIIELHHDQETNYLWGLAYQHYLFSLDEKLSLVKHINNPILHRTIDFKYLDKTHFLLLTNTEVYLYNTENDKILLVKDFSREIKNLELHRIVHKDGIYYLSSKNGLIKYDPSKDETIVIGKDNGLLTNSISSLIIDRDNNIWMGSETFGLNQLSTPNIVSYNEKSGLNNQSINAVQQVQDRVYIGTDEGLYYLENDDLKRDAIFEKLNKSIIWDIDFIKNDLFIASEDGLNIFRQKKHLDQSINNQLPKTTVINIAYFDEKIWLCTLNGLFYIENNEVKRLPEFDKLNINNVWSIQKTKEGFIWVGSRKALIKISGDSLKILEYYDQVRNVYSIVELDNNAILIGSEEGVWKIAEKQFHPINREDGLSGLIISGILKIASNEYWIATENGISIYNGQKIIHTIDKTNGLISNEVTTENAMKIYDNKVYLGMFGGLTVVKNTQDIIFKSSIQVYIKEIVIRTDTLETRIPITQHQDTVYYFDYGFNSMEIRYLTPFFNGSSSIRYSYLLENFDNQWSPTESLAFTRFTKLPSGFYEFKVKALSGKENYSVNVAKISVNVSAPYWQSVWFILLMLVLLLLCLYFFFIYITASARKRNAELELRVERRTRELQKAKAYNEQIIELAAIAIITLDREKFIKSWNLQSKLLFGFKKEEILGKSITKLEFDPDDITEESLTIILDRIQSENFVNITNLKLKHKNGATVNAMLSGSIQINEENQHIGYTVLFSDIGEQIKHQQEQIRHEKLMAGIDAINRLLGTMSHYINNSVASILSMIQLYEESHQFEEKVIELTKDHTGRINIVIQSLKRLVENLNLKTKDYAGEKNILFDIDNDIREFDERMKLLNNIQDVIEKDKKLKN